MAAAPKGGKAATRKSGKRSAKATSPVSITAPTAMAPEIRDELMGIMQELLMKTHELSFEYSTLDCEKLVKCPLACKSRELFKVVKRLNELVKSIPTSAQPPPGIIQ